MASPHPDQAEMLSARMRELLSYDPLTGLFHWRVKRKRVFAGDLAGSLKPLGYIMIMIAIDKRDYAAHNLAWLWMTGKWPNPEVDHKDLDKSNNRWTNLREATRSQNCANKRVPATSKLGVKGVGMDAGKIRGRAYINRKSIHLGYFDTIEAASKAVTEAGTKLHGEFYHGG